MCVTRDVSWVTDSLPERASISDPCFKTQLCSVHWKYLQQDDIQKVQGWKVGQVNATGEKQVWQYQYQKYLNSR